MVRLRSIFIELFGNNVMTPAQVDVVQNTFSEVAKIKDTAADLFYNRLFELDPSLKSLFKGNMTEQRRKLMMALGTVVASLKSPEKIIPTVQTLGEKHYFYGVEDRHYETVGAALLWTLEKGLGDALTPAVKAAWAAAYTLLSSVMIEAAKNAPAKGEGMKLLSQAYQKMETAQ